MEKTKQPNWRLVFWGLALVPLMMAFDAALKRKWEDVLCGIGLCYMFTLHARGKE